LKKILLFCVALSFSVTDVCAQSKPSEMKLSESFIFQWTGENGLISNNITSAIQAQTGFIWITTYNGIMRFDGVRVDVFDRSTIPFLATDAFYRVYEDAQGMLWFASQGSGIIQYDGKDFKLLKASNGPVPKSARCLLLDNSVIWIGSNNEGLLKLADDKIETVEHPLLKNLTILSIARDKQYLWLATDGAGVMRYDGQSIQQYSTANGLLSNTVNAISITDDGVYAGTNEGVNIIKDEQVFSVESLKSIHVSDIATDSSGKIWIAADNGLGRINRETQMVELVGQKNGFPFNRINSLAFDKEGGLWLGTGRSGLIQVKDPLIVNLTTFQGLSNDRINVTYETKDAFYIGNDVGQLDVYQNGVIRNIPIRTPLKEAAIRDICLANDGNLWIGTYKGLINIRNGIETALTDQNGLPANDVRRILKSNDGSIWVATRSGGVANMMGGKFKPAYNKRNGLESDYVLALEQDEAGTVYVGTHSGGLTLIKPDGSAKTFHLTDNDAGVLIFNIHIQSPTRIFIVANIGFYLFDGNTFRSIEIDRTFKGETHFDWVFDKNGDAWISTNIGLLRLKGLDLELFLKGQLKKVPAKLFDNQDGMKNKECTGATRLLISSKGQVWVPTIGGVSILYPDNVTESKVPPPVYISSLYTDSDTLMNTGILINPGNMRYVFNYTALSFKSPGKQRFRYKLEGFNDVWLDAGTKRDVEYTNLEPGSYTFRVMGCNSDGVWNTVGASYSFTVLPYFYQTTLFYVLVLALFLIIVYAIYRWRLRSVVRSNAELKKLNEELDNFVYSTSHDLRAPLTSIMGLINLSRLEKTEDRDEYINLMERSVKKMDDFIREITDFSRNARLTLEPVKIDFLSLIQETFEHLRFLDMDNRIERNILVEEGIVFYSDKLRISIILNNLITNAIKYSNAQQPNQKIEVEVRRHENGIRLIVKDNGIGIKPEQLSLIFEMFYRGSEQSQGSGLGLYIVKETVHKLKGGVTVKSQISKGSTFEVVLPSLH
jgi:signal transduction histidine kinase/ligand-binding sensor domain-containing protein